MPEQPNQKAEKPNIPSTFFDKSSLVSVAGCSVVAWVITCAVCDVFSLPLKIVGLISSILVSYCALLVSKNEKSLAAYVIAFLNGFLIYAFLVGSTQIIMPSQGKTQMIAISSTIKNTNIKNIDIKKDKRTSFLKKWYE